MERSLGHAEEEVGAEQTMTLLCQIEVLMAQGKSAPEVSHPPFIRQGNGVDPAVTSVMTRYARHSCCRS
jgi:hypothetical protein